MACREETVHRTATACREETAHRTETADLGETDPQEAPQEAPQQAPQEAHPEAPQEAPQARTARLRATGCPKCAIRCPQGDKKSPRATPS